MSSSSNLNCLFGVRSPEPGVGSSSASFSQDPGAGAGALGPSEIR